MTRAATNSKPLMRILATPSRVASTLDWKKSTGDATIATLDIHADRIGVRISQHPKQYKHEQQSSSTEYKKMSLSQASTYYSFPVSPKGWSKIPTSTRRGLSDLIHRHGVCGFVVSWPIQEDTGRMGAACGRTLFAIEELLRDHHNGEDEPQSTMNNYDGPLDGRPVFVPGRPLCLWVDRKQRMPATADAFGRSPSYARTTPERSKDVVATSDKEPPQPNESIASLSRVWEDFARAHWPDLNHEGRQNSCL